MHVADGFVVNVHVNGVVLMMTERRTGTNVSSASRSSRHIAIVVFNTDAFTAQVDVCLVFMVNVLICHGMLKQRIHLRHVDN